MIKVYIAHVYNTRDILRVAYIIKGTF